MMPAPVSEPEPSGPYATAFDLGLSDSCPTTFRSTTDWEEDRDRTYEFINHVKKVADVVANCLFKLLYPGSRNNSEAHPEHQHKAGPDGSNHDRSQSCNADAKSKLLITL